jgi:putative hydrolase of the HAD superfamily
VTERSFVWFDFGGVLSPPLRVLFDTYRDKTGVDHERLWGAMTAVSLDMGMPPLAPVELALLTEREWGARMRRWLSVTYPELDLSSARLEEFGEQWFAGIEVNPVMAQAAQLLREQGFGIGILTNNVLEWEPHWRRITDRAGSFDAIVDSCKVGVRKPQREIFRIAEKESGVSAASSVLIDDVAENCAAAEEAGWRTVHFQNDAQACRELSVLTEVPAIAR